MATDTRPEAKVKSFGVNMESDLAIEFLRVVEKAAIASARTMARAIARQADQVATEAMRQTMDTVPMRGNHRDRRRRARRSAHALYRRESRRALS